MNHTALCLCLLTACVGTEGDLLRAHPPAAPDLAAPDLAAPPPPPDLTPAPPECVIGTIMLACSTESALLGLAKQACTGSLGMAVVGDACGVGMYQSIKYQCCPLANTPVCITERQGGADSCKSDADWKQSAAQACALVNLTLTDIKYSELCAASSYRYAAYQCCGRGP